MTMCEPGPYVIVSASMGAGHTDVADELARRLNERGRPAVAIDMLDLLPAGMGAAMRTQYWAMLNWAPGLYDRMYRRFFDPAAAHRTTAPVVAFAENGLRRIVAAYRPAAVVSTFHLAGVAVGRLRQAGELAAPAIVAITEFAAHELWLHPGNDLFLCQSPVQAARIRARHGYSALAPGPIVPPRFGHDGIARGPLRERLGLPSGTPVVLIASGSWGTGDVDRAAAAVHASGRYTPVVLCGRNRRLKRDIRRRELGRALGWVPDVAPLMRTADAMIDNGGGLMCTEAFAARLPVVAYLPLPGHGRAGTRRLAEQGLVRAAERPTELVAALDELTVPGPARRLQVSRASALFAADAAEQVIHCAERPSRAPRRVPDSAAS